MPVLTGRRRTSPMTKPRTPPSSLRRPTIRPKRKAASTGRGGEGRAGRRQRTQTRQHKGALSSAERFIICACLANILGASRISARPVGESGSAWISRRPSRKSVRNARMQPGVAWRGATRSRISASSRTSRRSAHEATSARGRPPGSGTGRARNPAACARAPAAAPGCDCRVFRMVALHSLLRRGRFARAAWACASCTGQQATRMFGLGS